jgi:hypothetical protein
VVHDLPCPVIIGWQEVSVDREHGLFGIAQTLTAALNDASITDDKQRTVVLGDLAAVEAALRNPEAVCIYAEQALEQLGLSWDATGMDRVLEVRKALQPWTELDCVQALDDRLYGWQATLSTLQH